MAVMIFRVYCVAIASAIVVLGVGSACAQNVPGWQLGQAAFSMPGDESQVVQANGDAAGDAGSSGVENAILLPGLLSDETSPGVVGVAYGATESPAIQAPIVDPAMPVGSGAATGTADQVLQGPPVTMPSQGVPARSPMGRAIEAGMIPPKLPLQEETTPWYMVPMRWMQGWENHAEFGLDGSSGNADTLALQTGLETKLKTDAYTLAMDIDYRKATSRGVTTEDNGRFNLDYDRLLGDSPWSGFGKFGAEFDQFKNFDARINLNGGVGYHWIRTDDALLVTRFGAGASREIGALDDDWKPEGVFGFESEYQVNRQNKMKAKVDYFPNWEDFEDYRVVTDLAWEILLDDKDNLSLKLAATDRYDSTPQGDDVANDIYYSLLLLVKF